jgi:protein SCO1/2
MRTRTCKQLANMAGAVPVVLLLAVGPALGSDASSQASHDHHHHHDMAGQSPVRSEVAYDIPDVALIDAGNRKVALRAELADSRTTMVNFIFTSCTSICPVMSRVFAEIQSRLNGEGKRAHLVSISIDPEYDTPARLKEYATGLGAGPDWLMLTGRLQDSIAVQRAFDSYRGDKMNHLPSTFIRAGATGPWIRIDGLASADELLAEYRRLDAKK